MMKNANPPQKVLIIDDDEDLCTLLADYLKRNRYEASYCTDSLYGVSLALSSNTDIVVLDVMMPKLDGFAALKKIRLQSDVPIIMLTAVDEAHERIQGLELGADDYLVKPFVHKELLARINALTRRITSYSPAKSQHLLTFADIKLDTASRQATADGLQLQLTSAEISILEVLLRHGANTCDKSIISRLAFARPLEKGDRSIDVHVSNIRKKIAKQTEVDRIKNVRGVGYVLVGDKIE